MTDAAVVDMLPASQRENALKMLRLLRAHGEIDYPEAIDALADAVAASTALRDDSDGRFSILRRAFHMDGDDADLLLLTRLA